MSAATFLLLQQVVSNGWRMQEDVRRMSSGSRPIPIHPSYQHWSSMAQRDSDNPAFARWAKQTAICHAVMWSAVYQDRPEQQELANK